MKKVSSLVALLCLTMAGLVTRAQTTAASYIFSQSNGTYTALSSPTTIYGGYWDDGTTSGVPIGFTFNYLGTNYTSVTVCANGWLTFNGSASNSYTGISSVSLTVAAGSADLFNSNGAGSVTYQTSGNSPNRVFTVQYSAFAWYSTANTGPNNMQIQLYEGTNIIQTVYGTFSGSTTTNKTCQVGINGTSTSDFNNRTATTAGWSSTTAGGSNTSTVRKTNTLIPPSGLTFTWTPPPTFTAVPTSLAFGPVSTGATSPAQTFTVTGVNLSAGGAVTVTPPSGYEVSPNGTTWYTSGSPYTTSYSGTSYSGSFYVHFMPTSVTSYNGNISISGGGAPTVYVALTGNGAIPCSGTPTPGTAVASPATAYSSTAIGLSLTGTSAVGGLAYQWQRSTDNTTWTNISGATNYSAVYSGITNNTYFRAIVTCPSYTSANATSVLVNYIPPPSFCTPSCYYPQYFCGNSMVVASASGPLTLTGEAGTSIVDANNCTSTAYKDLAPLYGCTLYTGTSYPLTYSYNPNGYEMSTQMWIDFNSDGNFQSSESVGGGMFTTMTTDQTITIPGSGIAAGVYRLRVVADYACSGCGSMYPQYPNVPPCPNASNVYYAETRDYRVTVLPHPPVPVVSPTSLNFGVVTVSTVAPAQTFTISGTFLNAGPLTLTAPAGYEISFDGISGWSTVQSISYTAPNLAATLVYVRFTPAASTAYPGTITIAGGGLAPGAASVVLNGVGAPVCTGTPAVAAATASPVLATPGTNITLSLTGVTAGGLGYQWQSSLYSAGGFTDIAGATNFNYVFSGLRTATWYRCVLTCPSLGVTASNPVQVNTVITPTSCTPSCVSPGSVCGNYWFVASPGYPFTVTGENNTSINDAISCNSTTYRDFTSTYSATFAMGSSYTTTVGYSNGNQNSNQIWIDFNNDGVFQAGEIVGGTTTFTSGQSTPTIDIPATGIIPGTYRMRIIADYACSGCGVQYPQYPNIPPCPTASTMYYGEVRDYKVTIIYPPCTGAPAVGTSSADITASCAAYNANLLLTAIPPVSGVTYTWQSATTNCSTCFTDIAGANNPFYTAVVDPSTVSLTNGTVYYREMFKCNNSGGSTAATNVVALVLNNPPAVITGSPIVCTGSPFVFASATSGGTWSVGNPAYASIGLGSGIVTGISAGNTTITYMLTATGCYTTQTISVNTTPVPITGATNACQGETTNLFDLSGGGNWSSSDPSVAAISGSGTSGLLIGYNSGVATITYADAISGCYVTTPFTVNALPPAIGGNTDVCVGSSEALSNAISGGVWTTSSAYYAAVDPGTGIVTGGAQSTPTQPTITYTLPTGCYVTSHINVNPLPYAISPGAPNVCAGDVTSLTGIGGGSWTSQFPSVATIDPVSGVASGVSAGSTAITYTLPVTGCKTTALLTVNALPAPFPVILTNGGSYCPGGAGVHLKLGGSANGVTYVASETGGTILPSLTGSSSGLDFGLVTVGTYSVQATNLAGCTSYMPGNATVTLSPTPTIYNAIPTNATFCTGNAGAEIKLDKSDNGVSYQLYYGLNAIGTPVSGTGSPISMGAHAPSGASYTILAIDNITGCTSGMAGSVNVTEVALPAMHTLAAARGGVYCSYETGVDLSLSNSSSGVSYDLYRGTTLVITLTGTGTGSFPLGNYAHGVYTVKARDGIGCEATMPGIANVMVSQPPVPYTVTVTNGGHYCVGSPAVRVGLANSTSGSTYDLYLDGIITGQTVSGANSSLDFGPEPTPGTYKIRGVNMYGCSTDMTGEVIVVADAPPIKYAVNTSGAYCPGTAGSDINLTSDPNVWYQLYRGITAVGSRFAGGSNPLHFPPQTATGTYTVKATDMTSSCTSAMLNSVNVSISPLPAAYSVNTAGVNSYCPGTAGVPVYLSNSTAGNDYVLLGGVTTPTITSTGGMLNFGPQLAGTYTVIGYNAGTLRCSAAMTGNPTITAMPAPTAYPVTITGSGRYCAGGSGVRIAMPTSSAGTKYQLQMGSSDIGSPLTGTGSALDFGMRTMGGTYTILAKNVLTGCTSNMTNPVSVIVDPLPAAYDVLGTANYCANESGTMVSLSDGEADTRYYIYKAGALIDSVPVTAVTGAVSLGVRTAGVYTVKAMNMALPTACKNDMNGNATIGINPLPTDYPLSGGGNYCVGSTTGVLVGMANSASGISYELFDPTGTSAGVRTSATGGSFDFSAQTAVGPYTVVATNTATTCSVTMTSSVSVGTDMLLTPAVTVAPANAVICDGSTATFTAVPVNGGTSPVYQWMVRGAIIPSVTGNSYSYIPADDDDVTATLTSSEACVTAATAASTYTVNTTSPVDPSVVITTTPTTTGSRVKVCRNETVVFTPNPDVSTSNATTPPSYSWVKNSGAPVAYGPAYTYTATDDEAVIFCLMTSYADCRNTTLPVFSNNVVVDINTPATPEFIVFADPGISIANGQSVTFKALDANLNPLVVAPGDVLTYQWKLNGVNTANTATYTPAQALKNNDLVTCTVKNANTCDFRSTTNSVHMEVSTVGITEVAAASDVRVVPNPNKGTFTIKGTLATAADQQVTVEITNMLGQVVYKNNIMALNGVISEQVQLSNALANGMYLLNLRSGTENTTFHFVMEQ